MATIAPVTPGEILLEEFMRPLGLTQYAVAKAIGVDQMRIARILRGTTSVTADTALRLSRLFGTSELFWLNLQDRHDIETERDRLGSKLDSIEPLQPC